MIEWFSASMLVLNLEKTNIMRFVTINQSYCALTISHKDKWIDEVVNLKFHGIQIDSLLNWKNHIEQIIPKLSVACYMVRQMYHICNNVTFRSIYFAYFHSNVSYGIILWGNSSDSRKIFTLQKRIIRIMKDAHPRTSYRKLFKNLDSNSPKPMYTHWWVFFIGNRKNLRRTHRYIV